jgi:NADPH:quinone reductase-like Zn-dependent oxidoreductase
VLLRVHAAGVDRGIWHLMAGLPYPVRLAGYGIRAPKTPVRGREVAGRVEAVGGNVTALAVGEEVFGSAEGSFAEYARARADKLAPKPSNLTFAQAAAVPVSGLTALRAVRDHGHVQAGQQVLVIGASGGVGTFAVQIAKASGADGEAGDAADGKAQLADLRLQGVGRVRRLPVAPQHVDQPVGADRLPSLKRQQGQQGPLLVAADRHRHAIS